MNILVLALALALMPAGGQAQGGIQAPGNKTPNTQNQPLSQRGIERIVEEVHHQLVLLPYYGVVDNLAYKVSPDGTVTLRGQVARPTWKADAERVLKKLEAVERVGDQLQQLPNA